MSEQKVEEWMLGEWKVEGWTYYKHLGEAIHMKSTEVVECDVCKSGMPTIQNTYLNSKSAAWMDEPGNVVCNRCMVWFINNRKNPFSKDDPTNVEWWNETVLPLKTYEKPARPPQEFIKM